MRHDFIFTRMAKIYKTKKKSNKQYLTYIVFMKKKNQEKFHIFLVGMQMLYSDEGKTIGAKSDSGLLWVGSGVKRFSTEAHEGGNFVE